jgi:competence protein ComEC
VALLLALDVAGRLRGRFRWGVAGAAAVAVLLAWPTGAATRGGALELHFLDVGQGDATAIRTPAGRWLLIDAGPRGERYDAGERRVLPFLRARGVHRLEALLLTHPDADHIGGAPAVLEGIAVGRVIEPGLAVGRPLYLETLRAAQAKDVAWNAGRSGRTLRLDDVSIELLWPDADLLDSARDANDISLVALIRFGDFTALLTGDAPAAVEAELVQRHGDALRAQLLKAGHHGSRTSTSATFLDVVRPELVIVSAGRRNRYGHPATEVMRRLDERGIAVARTDRDGTISVRVSPGGATWEWVMP